MVNFEFIKEMLEDCDFQELCEDNAWDQIREQIPVRFDSVISFFDTGATKAVIGLKGEDFVIKIPFNCSSVPYAEYDDEGWEVETGDYSHIEFEGARLGDSWNYCKREASLYELGLEWDDSIGRQESNIREILVQTELLGEVNGYPIYRQAICVPFYADTKHKEADYSMEDRTSAHSLAKEFDFSIEMIEWLIDAIREYGEERVQQFLCFAQEEEITDMHGGNFGYKNNKPVIFDYAGYNE